MRFITLKKEQNNYSKCSAFASSTLFIYFHFKLFLPQGARYPSYATAFIASTKVSNYY